MDSHNSRHTTHHHSGGDLFDTLFSPYSSPWIQYGTKEGTINGQSGETVTFTASPSTRQSGDSESFDATVEWSDGSFDVVSVTIDVVTKVSALSVSTNALSFEAPAGYLASTNFYLNNTGTVALAYTILDKTAQSGGYSWTTNKLSPKFYEAEATAVSFADTDEGYSHLIPIGFPFSYFGTVYTQLSVGVNGGISLGEESLMTLFYTEDINEAERKMTLIDRTNTLSTPTPIFLIDPLESSPDEIDIPDQMIAPYWGDLYMNGDSSIEYYGDFSEFVVSWNDMAQRDGGSALTFQVTLTQEGQIIFQYESLSDSNVWPNTIIGLRDTSNRTFSATLSNAATTVTTELVEPFYSETVTTNGAFGDENPGQLVTNLVLEGYTTNFVFAYKNEIENQTILFQPNQPNVLTVDPRYGTLSAGASQLVTVLGDARSLTDGGTNIVSAISQFEIHSDAPTLSVDVDFNAVDSHEPEFLQLMAKDSNGDGWRDVEELAFGSDGFVDVVQNADGSRTLSWVTPNDSINRNFTVWYTMDLTSGWTAILPTLGNNTSFIDDDPVRKAAPVIYYKVTVE